MGCFAGPSPKSNIAQPNLVAYVDFGNNFSYRLNANKNFALDLSGNSKNATITAYPTITSEFNGGLVGNDTFPGSNMTTGPNLTLSGAFTVMVWVKTAASTYGVLQLPLRFNDRDIGIQLLVSSTVGTWKNQAGAEGNITILSGTGTNTIYHWAFSYNGVATFKSYSQGVLQNTITPGGISSIQNAPTFPFNLGYNWPGTLYSSMIYDRQLTDSEVTQNFNAHRSRFGV